MDWGKIFIILIYSLIIIAVLGIFVVLWQRGTAQFNTNYKLPELILTQKGYDVNEVYRFCSLYSIRIKDFNESILYQKLYKKLMDGEIINAVIPRAKASDSHLPIPIEGVKDK